MFRLGLVRYKGGGISRRRRPGAVRYESERLSVGQASAKSWAMRTAWRLGPVSRQTCVDLITAVPAFGWQFDLITKLSAMMSSRDRRLSHL
ncbi:hypothetical protein ACVWXQ_000199 [Bradyrhizobium sp. S3.14.4]